MKTKVILFAGLGLASIALLIGLNYPRSHPQQTTEVPATSDQAQPVPAVEPVPPNTVVEAPAPDAPVVAEATRPAASEAAKPALVTNRVELLNHIRETFRALAAGDPTAALRAARQIRDETERETALMTLVTEWTQGQLFPTHIRAALISQLGLEAALGRELAQQPELAALWAMEMTEGDQRRAILVSAAANLLKRDPAAAFALGESLPETERPQFANSLFAAWAEFDTSAAFEWANGLEDPAARDAAGRAIRATAPVGIGVVLGMQDGLPVINDLVPGAPAALSGQILPGDRIVAVAQGDKAFVDARGLPLSQLVELVRGAPNTLLQLQLLAANAPPDSAPRTVALIRDQLKFKK